MSQNRIPSPSLEFGKLIFYAPVSEHLRLELSTTLGIPYEYIENAPEGFAGCVTVRRINLLDLDDSKGSIAVVEATDNRAEKFLRDMLRPVMSGSPLDLIIRMHPDVPRSSACIPTRHMETSPCCSSFYEPEEERQPESNKAEGPSNSFFQKIKEIVTYFEEDTEDDDFNDDTDVEPASTGASPETIPDAAGMFPAPSTILPEPENDRDLEAEHAQWIEMFSEMLLEYSRRYHRLPPAELIRQKLEHKAALTLTPAVSSITVNADLRIVLPEYDETEIRMTPLARTVYILFLLHPEGLYLNRICDYAGQLAGIYSVLKPTASEHAAATSIADLCDPLSGSLNQKLSLIRRAIDRHVPHYSMASHYHICGTRGGLYKIPLDASMRKLPAWLKA